MLLDLSEIFVCPRCRPAQGLVVLVDEIRDRRVVRGHLGCPECEARVPVEDGVLRFDAADPGDPGPPAEPGDGPAGDDPAGGGGDGDGAELFGGASRREAALRLGALLGLPEAEGPFLLGSALGALAAPLAGLAEDEEVLALEHAAGPPRGDAAGAGGGRQAGAASGGPDDPDDGGPAGRRVTRVVGVAGTDLPVFSGRLGAVALLGGPAGAVGEAVRTLRAGGRIVVVEPSGAVADAVDGLPVEVAARDARALVGVRRG